MDARVGRGSADAGQVVAVVAVVMLVVVAIAVVIVAVGGVLSDRATARTAADAAALVAAVDTDEAAAEMAAVNGARLLAIHRNHDQVEVIVSVGRATARARAEPVRRPAGEPAHGSARPIP
jgi:hypothetical protein